MVTKEQINFFLSDPDYLSLVELEREQRLLFITDLSETRVSAFLGWLFKPYEGHGLGDRAVRELLLNVWRTNVSDELGLKVPEPKEVMNGSFRDLLVETEYQIPKASNGDKRRSIDIVLISRSQKLVVAIENKFGSSTHSDQLNAYRLAIAKKFPDYAQVLVYLDSNEVKPQDQGWIALDYEWIVKMIAAQQEAGLLSNRAIDALSQVKEYLSQDGATFNELAVKKDRLIETITDRHSSVLEIFRKFRNESWQARLEDSSKTIVEPLVIEFHQRWSLWYDVLDQSHHAKIIKAAKATFGDRLEVSSSPIGVFFRLKLWSRFEVTDAEFWGPQVFAWRGRDAKASYLVSASIVFKNIRQDREAELRQSIKDLRDTGLKAAPKAALRIRLSQKDDLSISQASDAVIDALTKLNLVFLTLP